MITCLNHRYRPSNKQSQSTLRIAATASLTMRTAQVNGVLICSCVFAAFILLLVNSFCTS